MHTHELDDKSKLARIRRNKEWLPLGAVLGDYVNDWASAGDLAVYIGDDGAGDLDQEATAFYDPRERAIEISTTFAFGSGVSARLINPEYVRTRKGLSKYPVLGGLCLHESMHAKHSTFPFPEIQEAYSKEYGRNKGSQAMKIYIYLEELRIEYRGVKEWPRDVGYLRASARKLATPAPKLNEETGKMETPPPTIVGTTLLALMRQKIGVLKEKDVSRLRKEIIAQMDEMVPTADGADVLRQVWDKVWEFINLNDYFGADERKKMRLLGKEVYDLFSPYMPKVNMPDDGFGDPSDGDGDGSEGEGTPSPDGQGGEPGEGQAGKGDLSESASSALDGAMDSADLGGAEDAFSEAKKQEREQQAKEAEKRTEDQKINEKKSQNTFERSSGTPGKTRSRMVSQREPTTAERKAMITFTAALQGARYRDRAVGVRKSTLPPGKLLTGAAMRDAGERWAGSVAGHAELFKGKRRTHVDQPKLTVGIIKDISGSMGGTMEPMSVVDWIVSNSAHRAGQANVASLCYGGSVFPTLFPGEKQTKVTKYDASDWTEEFDTAFRAIDGKLKLLNGSGVRLLVICSDGNYRDDQEKLCRKWLAECQRAGVGVLWLGLKQGRAESYIKEMGRGGEFVQVGEDVLKSVGAISAAALKALRGY